jgi:hypothetical protein
MLYVACTHKFLAQIYKLQTNNHVFEQLHTKVCFGVEWLPNFHSHWHYLLEHNCLPLTCLKSHIWVIQIDDHHHISSIKVGNLGSWPNNIKYGEKDARKVCWFNLYPMVNYGNCKSQHLVWPFWTPYFCKLCLTIYIICITNLFSSRWSCDTMQWSINVFSHKFWKSPYNFVS